MYRLVIADDEKRIRDSLEHSVEWEKLGFEVIGSFEDGSGVLEFFRNSIPDVILTDIKMANVTGLDVAQYVYENKLPCRVVLLSGYREFDLVLAGLHYGAEDYIIKPTQISELEATFIKIKNQLDERYCESNRIVEEKERTSKSISMLDELFWSDMVMGAVDDDSYIENCINLLLPDVELADSIFSLIEAHIDDYVHYIKNDWTQSADLFTQQLETCVKEKKGFFHFRVVYKEGDHFWIVIVGNKKDTNQLPTEIESLTEYLKRAFSISLIIVEHETCYGIKAFHQQCRSMMSVNNIKNMPSGLTEQIKILMSSIYMGNITTARTLMHGILSEIAQAPTEVRSTLIRDLTNALLSTLNTMKPINDGTVEKLKLIAELNPTDDTEEVSVCIDRAFENIKLTNSEVEGIGKSFVERALEYVRENIYRDVSQEDAANYLFISSSYLSRLFKQQIGESYIKIVTKIKMEKAMELLSDPQYKAYQVGEMLGYNTPKYFAKLFQSFTGLTPSAYRRIKLHLGEDNETKE